jgi:glutaredoxin
MFENHYVLITKGSCPACQGAIELLKSRSLNFIYTDMENAPQVLEVTKLSSGHATVPMIWEVVIGQDMQNPVENKFIGGFDDLQKSLGEVTETSE